MIPETKAVGLFLEGSYAAPIATDTTDAEGAYAFADLEPGSFKLRAVKAELKTT